MKGYSTTYGGIIAMIALPLLVNVGFSESCSNELVTILLPMIPGAIAAFRGRFKLGGIDKLGRKV